MSLPNQIMSKGSDDSYDTVVLEVRICRDKKTGATWSVHDLQDETDQEIVKAWPGWGIHALSSALVTEAVRRTTHAFVLTQMSHGDPGFLKRYLEASAEAKSEMEKTVGSAVEAILLKSIQKISVPAATEIITMMTNQIG